MAGFFEKLKQGLEKTRKNLSDGLDDLFGDYSEVGEDFFEELTEILIMNDLGIHTAESVVGEVQEKTYANRVKDPQKVREILKETIREKMISPAEEEETEGKKRVILLIGVNGVGKTTTAGKLAWNFTAEGKKVILCAADTFRAAAAEQLEVWADRTGSLVIRQEEGADPASVVYDAAAAMKSRNADILICDTAGRLHNKKNLMDELSKINRVLERELPDAKKDVYLVLDAVTGQNALSQAKEFAESAGITGIILTKMDGTAKGGIAVAVLDQLSVPVVYIGVGEQADDLQKFDAESFAEALIEK